MATASPPGAQANSPIIFILLDGVLPISTIVFNAGAIYKPQQLNIARSARGSIFNTATAAFLNDYGEAYPTLELSGTTGFGSEFGKGFLDFKQLELMFTSYLASRQESSSPNNVQLIYIDTINVEAFSCYPMRFTLQRTAQSPQLYFYNISLVCLIDLLETALYTLATDIVGSISGISISGLGLTNGTTVGSLLSSLNTSLTNLASDFAGILTIT